jgi:hypothetical protein
MTHSPHYLVVGDLSIDTVFVPHPKVLAASGSLGSYQESRWVVIRTPGGAWLAADMLAAAISASKDPNDLTAARDSTHTYPLPTTAHGGFDHASLGRQLSESIVLTKRFPKKFGGSADRDADCVYRIAEQVGSADNLDVDPIDITALDRDLGGYYGTQLAEVQRQLSAGKTQPTVTVIVDRNHGFRDHVTDDILQAIQCSELVLWKMDSPLEQGKLWEWFASDKSLLNKTVLVLKEECLRLHGVNLRKEGSIERTFSEFAQQLALDNRRPTIAAAAQLLVNFGNGVILYDRPHRKLGAVHHIGWRRNKDEPRIGRMAGYATILLLAAAKVYHHFRATSQPELSFERLSQAARLGLVLAEQHYCSGFAKGNFFPSATNPPGKTQPVPRPMVALFSELLPAGVGKPDPACPLDLQLAEFEVDLSVGSQKARVTDLSRWSRFEALIEKGKQNAEDVAIDIILRGLSAVTQVPPHSAAGPPWIPPITRRSPHVVYGKIQTLFRNEIDRFASIEFLVADYLKYEGRKRPLSLACFGAPGSGKGFTVKQILTRIDPDLAKNALNFNLSQFTSVRDLAVALHQVQDRVLARDTPLVIFDEFDASYKGENWGWLKYFLAPMQDGTFKEGDSVYRIGRAIFLFVGGVSHTFTAFADDNRKSDGFRQAKGPDFISRLRGHLDIPGIDHVKGERDSVLLRRAIIFRQLLEEHLPQIFEEPLQRARIEPAVIAAFLKVNRFKHGVRSMEAIIEMSHISPTRRTFTRSSIPPPHQLAMHVKTAQFQKLLDE